MHIKRVEEYSFSHGLNRDSVTGKFLPLQPHTFGRPLTHDEMDYNMRYMEQTLGGYKIFGSNQDTTLSSTDLDKSLILHRITPADDDYDRYVDGGYFSNNDFIWIPECCGDGGSGQPCNIVISGYTLSQQQATTGQQDVNITIFVNGLQGPPSFLINGISVTPDSTNGNQYTFNGYGAGTYSIIVTDTGVTDYTCDDNITVVITEKPNLCLNFGVDVTGTASGGEEDPIPCELDSITVLSASDTTVTVSVSGSWTGPLRWIVAGQPVPQVVPVTNVTSTVFSFDISSLSLSPGFYDIFLFDDGVLPVNSCFATDQFQIEDTTDPCLGFLVDVTANPAGGEEVDLCEGFLVDVTANSAGGEEVDLCEGFLVDVTANSAGGEEVDLCSGFRVDVDTSASGGIASPTICDPFTSGVTVTIQKDAADVPTGNVNIYIDGGSWGDISVEYTTSLNPDPSDIWELAGRVNQINATPTEATYVSGVFPSGPISLRITESINQCQTTESFEMPPIPE